MKKTVFTTLIMIAVAVQLFGQKLEENKKDDFTNKIVKRTSWETLMTTLTANAYFRVSQADSLTTFDFKYMDGTAFSIDKGQEMMFKLDNGEVIKLANLQFTMPCTGCGAKGFVGSQAIGIQVSYQVDASLMAKLKTNKVVKVRFQTSAGSYEGDVKDKNGEKVLKSFNLL